MSSALPRKSFWTLYIRAGDARRVTGVSQGSYLLRFTFGQGWEPLKEEFACHASFYEVGEPLVFTEREPTAQQSGGYTELTITLNEVPNGNLRREKISENDFHEGE